MLLCLNVFITLGTHVVFIGLKLNRSRVLEVEEPQGTYLGFLPIVTVEEPFQLKKLQKELKEPLMHCVVTEQKPEIVLF